MLQIVKMKNDSQVLIYFLFTHKTYTLIVFPAPNYSYSSSFNLESIEMTQWNPSCSGPITLEFEPESTYQFL